MASSGEWVVPKRVTDALIWMMNGHDFKCEGFRQLSVEKLSGTKIVMYLFDESCKECQALDLYQPPFTETLVADIYMQLVARHYQAHPVHMDMAF